MTGSKTLSETDNGSRTRLAQRIALGVAIVVAIVVRILFLDDKPFWRDEAWVALLVEEPGRAITDRRAAPIGFLWLTWLLREIVPGPPEVSYRFVPLLVGIAIVPLLAWMARAFGARRWVAVTAAWTAVGLVPLVYYSRELKSYDIDLLVAMIVPMLGIAGFDGPSPKRSARIALLALLVVAPWVSFACIFPIAALLAWGWLAWAPRATFELRRDLFLCSAAFTASFAVLYFVALSSQVSSPRLVAYWRPHMFGRDRSPVWMNVAKGVWNYLEVSIPYFFGKSWKFIVPLAVLGAITWPRPHRRTLLWMYFGTALFCISAALADQYVIAHGRHLLFALPPLLLWTAQGLWILARPFGATLRPTVVIALVVAFALTFSTVSVRKRMDPYHTNRSEFFHYDVLQDVDTAIAAAEPLVEPGDTVIISLRTSYAFQFYRKGRLPKAVYCERACPDWNKRASDWLAVVRGRAWMILADEEERSLHEFLETTRFTGRERLARRGVRVWELTDAGLSVEEKRRMERKKHGERWKTARKRVGKDGKSEVRPGRPPRDSKAGSGRASKERGSR